MSTEKTKSEMNAIRIQRYLVCLIAVLVACVNHASNAALFGPDNYAECLLENLPGIRNDVAVTEVVRKCLSEFPEGFDGVEPRTSIFGQRTWSECTLEYGREISAERGARLVRAACRRLYPPESR